MSVKAVNFENNRVHRFNNWGESRENPAFSHNDLLNKRKRDTSIEAKVSAASLLGVAAAFCYIAKSQGFLFSKLGKTPVKDWALFKIQSLNGKEPLKLREKEIIYLGAASVAGGLAGGAVFDDKKHAGAKAREAVNQLLGAVLIPLGFVSAGVHCYRKFESLAQNSETNLKTLKRWSEFVNGNKTAKGFAQVAVAAAALIPGIFAGNRVSNFINEKIWKKELDRDIKVVDFAPHMDDIGLAITMMSPASKLGSIVSRIVPFALAVPGMETGKAKAGQDEEEPQTSPIISS
ncbi:MAG: hypothetical protein LBK53_09745 [Heliobacteriaceae bacterium]|jgi:hypothetical protein|nr:hypothetical protein [Heliobacteriaceae bacterium]